ncbi:MAG: hypothetical protein PHF76_12620 [Bacteroidales bacterium]|nr:hypothetical protein [Bacteroidales bacterium]
MRKITVLIFALFLAAGSYAQAYKIQGKEVVKIEKDTTSTKTELTHTIGNETFPVFKSPRGAYYIKRVSKKTGKEYKQYLKIKED